MPKQWAVNSHVLSVSLSLPVNYFIQNRERSWTSLTPEQLARWLISSKLGRGLQGRLKHFQIGALTHGLLSKKLLHGTILQERIRLCIDLQEMVQHRPLRGRLHPPCCLLVTCSPWSHHPHGLIIPVVSSSPPSQLKQLTWAATQATTMWSAKHASRPGLSIRFAHCLCCKCSCSA